MVIGKKPEVASHGQDEQGNSEDQPDDQEVFLFFHLLLAGRRFYIFSGGFGVIRFKTGSLDAGL